MSIRNETAGSEQGPIPTGLKRVVVASMAGTVVEWYEFFLYGTAATLVFNKVFFAANDSAYGAIFAAFLTYAVGFVARPLGGIVFGHFGDKYGRKKLLQFAILLVGVVTFLMGCLPTYQQIGVWAPVLLGHPAVPAGLRRRRRVGWRGPAGGRTQPEQEPRLLGKLAASRRARRQHARHGRAVGADRDAVGIGVPVVGMAYRVLAVCRGGADRLLHPYQGHRCADLRRGATRSRACQGHLVRRHRGAQALPAWGLSPRWGCGSPRTSCIT